MAFNYYGTLNGNEGRVLIGGDGNDALSGETIIANSTTVTVGDAVKTDSDGNVALATSGDALLGIVVDVATSGGIPKTPDSGTLDTWTVEADNETGEKAYAIVDTSRKSLYSAAQDGTAGSTNNSNKRGAFIDAADEKQLDESTATRTRGTGGQFVTFGDDPDDSTRLIVAINESELESDS